MRGKYLERGQFINPATGVHFKAEDFRAPLVEGTEIEIMNRVLVFLHADDFTKKHFDQYVEEKILSDAEKLFRESSTPHFSAVNVRDIAKADKDNSKSISLREFKELIEGILDAEVDEESTKAVMNMFSKSPGYEIYYHDFCDALATKWTPPSYNSPNRIDQLEEQPAAKLREKKEYMRKLFRQFDRRQQRFRQCLNSRACLNTLTFIYQCTRWLSYGEIRQR